MIDKQLLEHYNIILASSSPRRRELIKGLDVDFCVAPKYDVDENVGSDIAADMVAGHLAIKKSSEYPFSMNDRDILITCDTVVIVGNEALGKPIDREEAIGMLKKLSAKEHSVITAFAFRCGEIIDCFSEVTRVKFKELSDEDIIYYVDHYSPYDKAGGYAIQEWIGYVAIERIDGSFYNVMGLPVCALYSKLENFINKLNKL